MSSEPFISNDLFILYSDLVLIDKLDETKLRTSMYNAIAKKKNTYIIIFLHTYLIPYYTVFLYKLNIPFVLITTCNDDLCVPYIYFPPKDENLKRDMDNLLTNTSLVRWFTKNPCIVHDKLRPLPLGPKWQYNSWHFFGEEKEPILRVLREHCSIPYYNFSNKELKSNLVYVNFAQTTDDPFFTHHKDMRQMVYKTCMDNGFECSQSSEFETYIKELKTYKFCITPPGRGVDTHRAWEALMVGTIPIMFSTPLDSLFENLPVVIVTDWTTVTKEFLETTYENIHRKTYKFDTLYSAYWKNILCSQ